MPNPKRRTTYDSLREAHLVRSRRALLHCRILKHVEQLKLLNLIAGRGIQFLKDC